MHPTIETVRSKLLKTHLSLPVSLIEFSRFQVERKSQVTEKKKNYSPIFKLRVQLLKLLSVLSFQIVSRDDRIASEAALKTLCR